MTVLVEGHVTVLSAYIKQQLRRQGKDAADIARESGLPETTVRPIVRGATRLPDINTLERLAGPLGVSFESLCRAAVDLEPVAPEAAPLPSAQSTELLQLFETLSPEEQARAVKALRALFE